MSVKRFTFWRDINTDHQFRQISCTTWEERNNGGQLLFTFVFVSAYGEIVNLFAKDRNFYIQLSCGKATWGNTLLDVTQKLFYTGYWIDANDGVSNICTTSNERSFILSLCTVK